jgi:hypothetical protein
MTETELDQYVKLATEKIMSALGELDELRVPVEPVMLALMNATALLAVTTDCPLELAQEMLSQGYEANQSRDSK